MKRILLLVQCLLFTFFLTACSSNAYYVVETVDDRLYTAISEPEYDDEMKTVSFTDQNGDTYTMHEKDIKIVKKVGE